MTTATLTWNDLPGPATPWWGLPALSEMRRDYLGFIHGLHQHGDLVRHRVANIRSVDVFDPELMRRIMVEHADALIRWERGPEVFAETSGQSVLVTEGATWQRQRRMLMQAFTPKRVAGYVQHMAAATEAGLASLEPGLVAMDELYAQLTIDVILRTLFSRPAAGNTREISATVQHLSAIGLEEMFWPMTLPDWLPLPGKAAKRRSMRFMRELIEGLIRDHRPATTEAGPVDLLSMLRQVRDDESGTPLSEQEIYDQCMVTFQAGHETTATALIWWSWLMAAHPQAQARAAEEVDQVLAGRTPSVEDLPRLAWLNASIKEAMRLHPPVAALMTRRVTRDLVVDRAGPAGQPLEIKRGTMLRITPWLTHRDARLWRDPEAFQPERFLPGAPDIPRGAYLPFGQGPRVCLGQHFATQEMSLIAAMLLQRWQLCPSGDAPPVPKLTVTLRPEGGLRLRLAPRG